MRVWSRSNRTVVPTACGSGVGQHEHQMAAGGHYRRRRARGPNPCRLVPTSGRDSTSMISSSPGTTCRTKGARRRARPNGGSLPAKRSSASAAHAPTFWAIDSHIDTPGRVLVGRESDRRRSTRRRSALRGRRSTRVPSRSVRRREERRAVWQQIDRGRQRTHLRIMPQTRQCRVSCGGRVRSPTAWSGGDSVRLKDRGARRGRCSAGARTSVDHVDHTVGRLDVRLDHHGLVDPDAGLMERMRTFWPCTVRARSSVTT